MRRRTAAVVVLVVCLCSGCPAPDPVPVPSPPTEPPTTEPPTTEPPTTEPPTTEPPTTEPPTTEPPTTEPPTTEPPTPGPSPGPTLPPGYLYGATSLTFYGVGDAGVGDTGEQVAATLGVDLTVVLEETDTCMAILDVTESVGVVIDEGTVQAFLVRMEGLWLEQVAMVPVQVGDHFDALYDAYPDEFLYAGPSEQYWSVFGGPRATISPTELAGTLRSLGRSVHYAGDPDGIIREIRVGSTSYVDQLTYCPGA